MNPLKRIEELERRARVRAESNDTGRMRSIAAEGVMMGLTLGGLKPDDPADTIEARYAAALKADGLTLIDGDPRLEQMREWYAAGVESNGWRPEYPPGIPFPLSTFMGPDFKDSPDVILFPAGTIPGLPVD